MKLVLRELHSADGPICGTEVVRRLDGMLDEGTAYGVLRRLERAGLATSEWVTAAGDPAVGRGPRHQRNYQLTPDGQAHPAVRARGTATPGCAP